MGLGAQPPFILLRVSSLPRGDESRTDRIEQHRALLRVPFQPDRAIVGLEPEEWATLNRYGSWLQALAHGAIRPFTAAQEHFVSVAQRGQPPVTEWELLWCKYLDRLLMSRGSTQEGESDHEWEWEWDGVTPPRLW